MSNAIKGRCLCGAVEYELTAEPVVTAICHCTHCSRQSGSLYSLVLGTPRAAFQLTRGELTTYVVTADSGNTVERKFCNRCGSPILSDVHASPNLVFVKAGTLDDWRRFRPVVEVYRSRTAEWVPPFEGVTTMQEG